MKDGAGQPLILPYAFAKATTYGPLLLPQGEKVAVRAPCEL
jgi:hypothetical protein